MHHVSYRSHAVIYTNCRARHGQSNYIPASYLPSFIDLVIWAHEHECRPEPEYVTMTDDNDLMKEQEQEGEELGDGGFYVYQPGSSVATSLCEGEVTRKLVSLSNYKINILVTTGILESYILKTLLLKWILFLCNLLDHL